MTINERRILIVEDNPDDESLTQRGLRDCGAGIQVACDGALALEALAAMERLPDLVLLDLKLPKIDGGDVLRQLRNDARTRRLCVVVFTSSSEPADIARCYALGCNSYVIKPVTYEDYIEAVRRIAAYWLALNVSPARER
jgi:two-component system response regulator